MRLTRSSLRISTASTACAAWGIATLCFGTACGAGAAAPTPTAVTLTPAAASAVPAPSPQRPALASPLASPATASTSATSPTAVAADNAADTYDVQSGDTMGSIADQFYGDKTLWRPIYDANKEVIGSDPDKLKIGMKLKIPPKPTPTPP